MKKTVLLKTLALLCAFALVFSACSKKQDDGAAAPAPTNSPVTEPVTLPATLPDAEGAQTPADGPAQLRTGITLRAMQYELENQSVDFPNLWFYKELEARTGVHIEFEAIKDGDWNTKLNMAFVSGDLPDIIIRPNQQLNVEEYGVTQGMLIPLDELIPTYMPNYNSRLGMNNVTASMYSSDGHIYWIGNLTAQNVNHEANFFINKTWLDTLGLAVPETVDQLTDVLKAFRDKNPGGADGVLPMSAGDLIHQTQGLYTHFAMFGVPLQRWVYAAIGDDGKVVFPGYMPGFREACEWLNMAYNEDLLDKESITQDSNAWAAKMNDGKVGFTTYLRLINTQLTADVIGDWLPILPPKSQYGAKVPRVLEIPTYGAVLTNANKYVPETLAWLDAQFETETMMVSVNGPLEGGSIPNPPIDPCIKINENGKYEIIYIPDDNGLYKYVPVYHGQFFAPGDYYFDIYQMPPHRVERFESSKAYSEAGVLEKNSYSILEKMVKLTSDEATEQARLFDNIDLLMQEYISRFITEGVTDAKWDEFIKNVEGAGVNEYIAAYQKAYDAYLAANK